MFLDSTMRLLSYETMLNNVLTGSKEGDAKLDHQGVGVMDTCGFPLFSHDLHDGSRNPEQSNPEILSLSDLSCKEDKVNTKNLLLFTGRMHIIDKLHFSDGSVHGCLE
jgi:hypothetical protein